MTATILNPFGFFHAFGAGAGLAFSAGAECPLDSSGCGGTASGLLSGVVGTWYGMGCSPRRCRKRRVQSETATTQPTRRSSRARALLGSVIISDAGEGCLDT